MATSFDTIKGWGVWSLQLRRLWATDYQPEVDILLPALTG